MKNLKEFKGLSNKQQLRGLAILMIIVVIFFAFKIISSFKDGKNTTYKKDFNATFKNNVGTTYKKEVNKTYKNDVSRTSKVDKLDGLHITYYEEGIIEEKVQYKNGIKDGIYELYDFIPASKKHYKREVGFYKNGKKNGLFKYYDYYYDAKTDKLGSKLILIGSTNFKNGLEHGKYKEYNHKYGFLLISTDYVDGIEHGIRRSYCPSGPDRGKLYIVQKVIRGQIQQGDYYCNCY